MRLRLSVRWGSLLFWASVILMGLACQSEAACPVPNPNINAFIGYQRLIDDCPLPAGTLNRAIMQRPAIANAPEYCPIIDGTTDNSSCLTSAVATLCSQSPQGGELYLSQGNYVVRDLNMPCPIVIRGAGMSTASINYQGATTAGLRWVVAGFPSITPSHQLWGGGISGVTLTYTSGSADALLVEGFNQWFARDVKIVNPQGGVHIKSGFGQKLDNVRLENVNGFMVKIEGDLSGRKRDGSACSTSSPDCSSRVDFVTLDHINSYSNGVNGHCVELIGFANTIMGEHIACEGFDRGLSITCPAGMAADLSQCPHFIFMNDFQNEFFNSYGLYATDFLDLKMDKPYFYGNAAAANQNNVYIAVVN